MPFSRSGNIVTVTGTETNAGFLTFCNGESDITVDTIHTRNTGRSVRATINGIEFRVSTGASLTLTDLTFDELGFRVARGTPQALLQFGNVREGVPVDPCVIILRSTRQGLGFVPGGSGAKGRIKIYGGIVKTVGPNRTDISHRDVAGAPILELNGCQMYREPGNDTVTSAFYANQLESNGEPIIIKGFSAGFQNPTDTDLRAPIKFVDIADSGFFIWMASSRGENLRDISFIAPSTRTAALITAKYKTSFIRGTIELSQIAFDRENTSTRDSNEELSITKFYSIIPLIINTAASPIADAQIVIEEAGGEVISRTTDAQGEADEMLPREWHALFSEQTGETGLTSSGSSTRHYIPTVTHTHTHDRLIYSYLHNLNYASSIDNAGELTAPFPFVMIDDPNITERTKATVDAWTTIAIDHTASPRTITVTGAHTLDDIYDKVKADKAGELPEPVYNGLAVTVSGSNLDLTQNESYTMIQSTAAADLTKGSKFTGIKGNLNAGSQTVKVDAFGGTISNIQTGESNVAFQNCVIGRTGETTTVNFTGATGTGRIYVLDNADLREATLAALGTDEKAVFILRNGARRPATLPTGYSVQNTLTVTVNKPSDVGNDKFKTRLYTTDAEGHGTTTIGSTGARSYTSTDYPELVAGATVLFAITGEGINSINRTLTLQDGVNTMSLDITKDPLFNADAPLNTQNGVNPPKLIDGTDVTNVDDCVTVAHITDDGVLEDPDVEWFDEQATQQWCEPRSRDAWTRTGVRIRFYKSNALATEARSRFRVTLSSPGLRTAPVAAWINGVRYALTSDLLGNPSLAGYWTAVNTDLEAIIRGPNPSLHNVNTVKTNIEYPDGSFVIARTMGDPSYMLRIGVSGFSHDDAPRATNVLTNRIMGAAKKQEEYLDHYAYHGEDTITFASRDQVLVKDGRYILVNQEGDTVTVGGQQRITSMLERDVEGVAGVVGQILNIELDGDAKLVLVIPNPSGVTADEISSTLVAFFRLNGIVIKPESVQTIANNTRDIVNTAIGQSGN